MGGFGFVFFLILIFGFVILSSSFKITQEYERAVVFRLGRFTQVKGPVTTSEKPRPG
jgi:regulator of protease activity HflC (stomatin/prohibitin superfamily)